MDGTNADQTASCLFLLLGPASGRMGHMFWLQTGVPDVPAACQLTLTPLGLPLGSVFLQTTGGRGLEDHQMGRMERSPRTGKSIAQQTRHFYPATQNGRILRTDRFPWLDRPPAPLARPVWRGLGACPRAQRATPRAGTPAVTGVLDECGQKKVLSFQNFQSAKHGHRRPTGDCFH